MKDTRSWPSLPRCCWKQICHVSTLLHCPTNYSRKNLGFSRKNFDFPSVENDFQTCTNLCCCRVVGLNLKEPSSQERKLWQTRVCSQTHRLSKHRNYKRSSSGVTLINTVNHHKPSVGKTRSKRAQQHFIPSLRSGGHAHNYRCGSYSGVKCPLFFLGIRPAIFPPAANEGSEASTAIECLHRRIRSGRLRPALVESPESMTGISGASQRGPRFLATPM